MAIRTITRTTHFYTDENGQEFELTFNAIENTLSIKPIESGFEARYLVKDDDPIALSEMSDDADRGTIFLVHYHRDFCIENKQYIEKDDLRRFYQGEKIDQQKKFWIFPVAAYIHSGVALSLGNGQHFPDYSWDVSHVGAILVNKKAEKSWRFNKKALQVAEYLLEEWNQYLAGDVYGIVKDTYDKDKKLINNDAVWGFYGQQYALEALQTDI